MDFRNRRVLITQANLINLAGSEIVTLELSEYFSNKGAFVTVYALAFGKPVSDAFAKLKNVKIIFNFDEVISFRNFDLVWVHHQVLPPSMLKRLESGSTLPVVIFNHMSSYIPLEFPYINRLEKSLASAIVFNSAETMKKQKRLFNDVRAELLRVFPNPAPKRFIDYKNNRPKSKHLEKILLVSNHAPPEILQALNELSKKGVEVTNIGRTGKPKLVTPQLLSKYDVIISVGKTVQYSLVMGIPVYCYDQFCGPGYLEDDNYKRASAFNFSGRGFPKKKSAAVIRNELLRAYKKAADFSAKKRAAAIKEFDIDINIEKVLSASRPKGKVRLAKPIVESFIVSQQITKDSARLTQDRNDLKLQIEVQKKKLIAAKSVKKELNALKNRKSVRLGLYLSEVIGRFNLSS